MYGNESDEYGSEETTYFDPPAGYAPAGPAAPAPRAPAPTTVPFRGNPVMSPLRHDTRFGGLGEFSADAVCSLRALDKLAWRFFWQVNEGSTLDALTTLNVFRALFNRKRAAIAPGFTAQQQTVLPVSLTENAWDQAMIRAVVLSFVGGLGTSDARLVQTLGNIPQSMAALPNWWTGFRDMLPAVDQQVLRAYIEVPMPVGGDPATQLAAFVVDDLNLCRNPPAASPPPPAAPPPAPPGAPPTRFPLTVRGGSLPITPFAIPGSGGPPSQNPANGDSRSSGGGAASSGGIGLLGWSLLGLVAYGAWLAYQDHQTVLRGDDDALEGEQEPEGEGEPGCGCGDKA
jgi:hypothetical protein